MFQCVAHHSGERQGVDVHNLHTVLRDDELPAGCHHVIACVLGAVTQFFQAGNHHVVVVILGEAQAALCEVGTLDKDVKRRVGIAAQVDLGVNQIELIAGFEAHLRNLVEEVFPFLIAASQHDALAVVTLLHAHIQVAVLVTGEEELFDEIECFLIGDAARSLVGPVIGVDVLVEAAQRVVVAVALPEGKMHHPEQLEGLPEGGSPTRMDVAEHPGDVLQSGAAGTVTVLQDEVLHGLDAFHSRRQEQALLLVQFRIFGPLQHLRLAPAQAVAKDTFIVWRYIGNGATLVKGMRFPDPCPFLLRKNGWNAAYGARSYNLLAFQDDGHFRIQEGPEHTRAALHGRKGSLGEMLCQAVQAIIFWGMPEAEVLPGAYEGP